MPRNAKCFVAEDRLVHMVVVKAKLKAGGHAVAAEASNERIALEMVGRLESLGVTVAILDGNLTPEDSSGRDGERISKAIRALGLNIHIICVSNVLKGYPWADHNVSKPDMMATEDNILAKLINRL